ncbi:UPF0251 protein [Methanobacterium lacus]|uniref:UPF0251 protein Metbo_0509 n=1 Tax=Methanobacterium lacus (strain AL-21) TaxID=877455 RepID=F0T9L3_METLA|nr:DUF134 domain-containing protein [Methanobacterium lacus]ADZ08761.1 UPF0251 protein [Methanobacterium lacus]
MNIYSFMVRPQVFRKISKNPEVRCFKPDGENLEELEPIQISLDEFEAIRLRDYHDIKQVKAASIMEISQPTFHRILSSARKKISKALIEGNPIIIVGDGFITDKKRYKCNDCGFEWLSNEKNYDKCLECQSENIVKTDEEDMLIKIDPDILERRSYGGKGLGAGPPKVCKCPKCGYEHPKTRTIPCRNTKCPVCETPLCGSND